MPRISPARKRRCAPPAARSSGRHTRFRAAGASTLPTRAATSSPSGRKSSRLHYPVAADARVVPAEVLDLAAKRGACEDLEEGLDGGQVQIAAADREVVALGREGDESESEQPRGRAGRDAAVGGAGVHLPRRRKMSVRF